MTELVRVLADPNRPVTAERRDDPWGPVAGTWWLPRQPIDAIRQGSAAGVPLLICDLTQSYSPSGGGGISTYLREKRDYVLANTDHRLLQIVPGPETRVIERGRHIFAEVKAPRVPGSPNYRFIVRESVVHARSSHHENPSWHDGFSWWRR